MISASSSSPRCAALVKRAPSPQLTVRLEPRRAIRPRLRGSASGPSFGERFNLSIFRGDPTLPSDSLHARGSPGPRVLLTCSAIGNIAVGEGTKFLTDLETGSFVHVGGQQRVVTKVTRHTAIHTIPREPIAHARTPALPRPGRPPVLHRRVRSRACLTLCALGRSALLVLYLPCRQVETDTSIILDSEFDPPLQTGESLQFAVKTAVKDAEGPTYKVGWESRGAEFELGVHPCVAVIDLDGLWLEWANFHLDFVSMHCLEQFTEAVDKLRLEPSLRQGAALLGLDATGIDMAATGEILQEYVSHRPHLESTIQMLEQTLNQEQSKRAAIESKVDNITGLADIGGEMGEMGAMIAEMAPMLAFMEKELDAGRLLGGQLPELLKGIQLYHKSAFSRFEEGHQQIFTQFFPKMANILLMNSPRQILDGEEFSQQLELLSEEEEKALYQAMIQTSIKQSLSAAKNSNFTCSCGQTFSTQAALNGHQGQCTLKFSTQTPTPSAESQLNSPGSAQKKNGAARKRLGSPLLNASRGS